VISILIVEFRGCGYELSSEFSAKVSHPSFSKTRSSQPTIAFDQRTESKLKQFNEDDMKLVFHSKNWEYNVIKDVMTNDFGFTLTEDDRADFDVIWHNTGMKTNQIKKLKSYQKYNHFPGMYQLANKRNLGRNLMRMFKLHSEEFKFFPKTWVLPNDYSDFVKHNKQNENQYYIIKPEWLSQGKGIYLTKHKEQINQRSNAVIQEYLQDPFLVDNLKFDIRLYVLVTSIDPLRIYLFEDGLVRFATVEYQQPTEENIDNTYIHLTNYAINKNNENFIFDEENSDKGHKRTLKSFWKSLNATGIATDVIEEEIKDIIVKTFLSVQPQLAHQYKSWIVDDVDGSSCFEILGFDIMLDENLDPFLIEVNHAPSFATDSNIDFQIKQMLIKDTFTLLNLSVTRKLRYKKEKNKIAKNRILTNRKEIISQEDKDRTKKLNNYARHKFEVNNCGHYEMLYPLVDKKNKVVGDINADYYWISKPSESSNALDSSASKDWRTIELGQPKTEPVLSEKEKLAGKYNSFIQDAFDQWDDFNNGYRIRSKNLVAEDDDAFKNPSKELGSRNPSKQRQQFQKTVRMGKRSGFGSSASRLDCPTNKKTITGSFTKNRRVVHPKPSKQDQMLMNAVLSKYISKSIVVSKDKSPTKQSQEKHFKPIETQAYTNGLPVIANTKTAKEINMKKWEGGQSWQAPSYVPANSLPKLPKVL